ncbi:unnamed protein product [Colias eurytheme]|nr:unnamed protein product [Colias eurytheme]
MNDDLERISDWSRKNALVLNPTKSKYLVVGSKKQLSHLDEEDIRICVNSIPIERVAVARNLGIDFDTQLSTKCNRGTLKDSPTLQQDADSKVSLLISGLWLFSNERLYGDQEG